MNARCPRCLSTTQGDGPICSVCGSERIERETQNAFIKVESIFLDAAEDRKLRWIRAAVGGAIGGLTISLVLVFVNDKVQLIWMAIWMLAGIAVGLVAEWLHPWASDEPNRFLELVGSTWPNVNGCAWSNDGTDLYRIQLSDSVENELVRLKIFFEGLDRLDWRLTSEENSTRIYVRRNRLLRASFTTLNGAAYLVLVVTDAQPTEHS